MVFLRVVWRLRASGACLAINYFRFHVGAKVKVLVGVSWRGVMFVGILVGSS